MVSNDFWNGKKKIETEPLSDKTYIVEVDSKNDLFLVRQEGEARPTKVEKIGKEVGISTSKDGVKGYSDLTIGKQSALISIEGVSCHYRD